MDGFAVCREVRRCGSVPVLIISARVGKEDQLNGFRLGADDYIEKPVDLDLLAAKIGSLFARTYGALAQKDILHSGSLTIDKSARKVYRNKLPVELNVKEYELLLLLAENPGKTLDKDFLFNQIWGHNAYRQIGEKTVQIENFVGEIIRASKEDIVQIEIEKGEFYLKELMGWVASVYGEKCALRKCELTIGTYQNRIFQGDIHRLREVFGNLFENAFKYGDCRRIQVSFYEEDYCQLIRVFNTGEPVTQKEFVHLFDSFFRGDNTRGQQGNGLGLYICREIMHRLDGEIFAVCEDDGMAFVVVLPL